MNSLKVFILMLALLGIFGLVGYLLGGSNGMGMALLFAMVMNLASYWFSDKWVLKMYRAKIVTEADNPRLFRVVRRVCVQANNLPMPKVAVVPSKAPNAFATGRNADNAVVAVTEGLLELLNEDELEGVVGHEVGHVINRDLLIGTIAATFAGAIGYLAMIARWGAIFSGYSRDNDRGGGIGLLIAAIVAPLAAMIVQMAISRQREFKADATSAQITGKPLSLASALEKLHRAPVRLNLDKRPATAHMMIANPLSGKNFSSLFSTHPPVEKRIDKLRHMYENSVYA